MNAQTLKAIKAHAIAEYPRESAGLVVAVGRKEIYRPCRNLASGDDHFMIGAEDSAAAEDAGQIVAVVHSHPNATAQPSQADRVACERYGLPWLIVSVMPGPEVAEIRRIEPEGYEAPLIGREFSHGVLDCYAIVRDFHRRELGNELPDHDRADEWWNDGTSNLYLDQYEKDGWVPVSEGEPLKVGDMVLMQIRSGNGVPNHAGVICGFEAGRPHMIHHLHGMRSERVPYGGYYAEVTQLVVRYIPPK